MASPALGPDSTAEAASTGKGSIDSEPRVTSQAQDVEKVEPFSKEQERKLVLKHDLCILPPLIFMYLCNALDKGNVGNAKTAHWDKDIGLTGDQYYLLVMIFYVPFCLFGTPISLLVKRFSAARVLPIMMVGFGSMSLFTGIAKNFSEVFAIRFFLGIFESAMLPGVVYYLSTFYTRSQLGSRIGFFYAAASIAGAFSGLIAYGVFKDLTGEKMHPWYAYLFFIEGAGTVAFAAFAFFWLPRSAETWWLLTEKEKDIARRRILADSSTTINEKIDFRQVFVPFKSKMYWLWALGSLSFGVPLASVNNFLPQIVTSLGYSTVKTNLLTVAPNVVGTVALLLLTISSDYFRERSIHICIALSTAIIGFVVLGSIDPLAHRQVAYFACFLITAGAFSPSVLFSAWYSNNTPRETQRAIVAAVMVAIANSAGLISTNVFRAQDEPKYVPALATSAAFGGLCLLIVAGMGIYMRRENARRNREQGVDWTAQSVETQHLSEGPKTPQFRYMY